jgi:hypothetical protein
MWDPGVERKSAPLRVIQLPPMNKPATGIFDADYKAAGEQFVLRKDQIHRQKAVHFEPGHPAEKFVWEIRPVVATPLRHVDKARSPRRRPRRAACGHKEKHRLTARVFY